MHLDFKDRHLLYELSLDSRQSISSISKKIGLKRDFVNYRISRLLKTKIIVGFIAEVNLETLGYSRNTVYLQLSNAPKEKEAEISSYLASHPFVTWLVTAAGKWNMIFDVVCANSKKLYEFLEELKGNYGDSISEYKLATLGQYNFFPEKYFGNLSEKKSGLKSHDIDSADIRILSALSSHARTSYIAIALKAHISPETARKKIGAMLESGIIKRFTISLNVSKLGLEFYNIQLVLERYDKKREKELYAHLVQHPKVSFIYKPLSNWDFEFGLLVKDAYELNSELAQIRSKFSDIVKIHDAILLIDEIVPNIAPSGIQEAVRAAPRAFP